MKHLYATLIHDSKQPSKSQSAGNMLSFFKPSSFIFKVLGLIFFLPVSVFAQNSLNSGDFSTGFWGVSDPMGASAGSSLIITKAVSSSGDKYFRFYGDGSPCGEYQADNNGDYFTHNTLVTAPNANCGSSNAWRINVPTASSNVVFKTDGGNDGMDRSIAFVVQGNVESVSSVTRLPSGNVYPGQDVVVTANLTADFSTGQAAFLRYTNDGFATSTVVQMTGSGTSRTGTIPGAANIPSTAVAYYIFTSADGATISGADADFYTINLNNNSGSNYTYTTQAGWTTVAAGNWGTAATWNANAIPPTNANMGAVSVGHNVTFNQDALVQTFTQTANTFTATANTLNIRSGGTFTRSGGTFTASATFTLNFAGSGTISGTAITTPNLTVNGALTVTTAPGVTGNFTINNGGSVSNSPQYGASSTLIYNSGGSYNVANEWTANLDGTAGLTRPQNVTIQNSTTLNLPAANLAMAGNLTITSGTLNMNAAGDLLLRGNWSNAGTFNPNNSRVWFYGASQSTIFKSGGETFNFLVSAKTAAVNLQLLSDVTISGSSGFPLTFSSTSTGLGVDLNGNNLSLSGSTSSIALGAGTALTRNILGAGNFIISGGTKTVTRVTSNLLVIASTVNVQLYSGLDFGSIAGPSSMTTLNGTLTINTGGFVSSVPPIYGAGSTLVYNSGGPYGVGSEWTSASVAAFVATYGRPVNVTIQTGTTVTMPTSNRALYGNLNISGGTLNLNVTSGDLLVVGNWTNSGTFNPNGRAVNFTGTSVNSFITNTSGETFDYLIVQKTTTGTLTLNNSVTIAASTGNVLQLISNLTNIGSIDLNGNTLTLSGTGGDIYLGASGTLVRHITGSTGSTLNITGGTKTVTSGATTVTLAIGPNVVVIANAGINFGITTATYKTTLNGTLRLNSGGSVVTNPPIYGAASTLLYYKGGTINTGTEWNQTAGGAAGAGRPADVTIDNNTTLELTASRGMARDLTIETGSSLVLNATTGSIIVGRSWTRETGATFTHNSRLVTFGAVTSNATINAPTSESFGPLTIAKTAAASYVTMNCNVDVAGALTMAANAGRFMIDANTLTLNGNVTTTVSTGTISGTSGSTLIVNGTGASCNLAFTTAVAENRLGSLTINRTGPGTVVLSSSLLIDNGSGLNNSILTLTGGWLQLATASQVLTVANTSVTGSSTSFVATTVASARMAFSVTGAGSYNLSYPVGSALNVNAFRPFGVNNLVQTGDNTYSSGAIPAAASTLSTTYDPPLLGMSTVRYYPFGVSTGGNLASIASVSLTMGADDNPSGIDNQTIGELDGTSWGDITATGGITKTSGPVSVTTTAFAFGFTTLTTIFVNYATGNDAWSGQNATNVPAGSGPKQSFNAAMSAVTNGGTVSYTGGAVTPFIAQNWDIDKNVHLTQTGTAANTVLTNVTINISPKSVMPFASGDVNTGTDEITVTAHQLVTGMAITYQNYGQAYGFMPSGINVGTDVLTVGGNIPTGQPVIYQAYPAGGDAGGLTHGNTYWAINVSPTTIRLAASYADAVGSVAVDITSAGTAESHGIIASNIEGLTPGTLYYAIIVDANTIKLATSNANALGGSAIDLVTAGGGNHVLYFTPVLSGILSFKTPLNVTGTSAYISPYQTLLPAANGIINVGAGTYFMQPTFTLTKPLILSGNGMGSTILDGGGKISSATSYYGVSYPAIALAACTLRNMTITRYYNGINRNSANTNTSNVILGVESSDNYCKGLNWEGAGAIATALTIREGKFSNNNGVGVDAEGIYISGMTKVGLNILGNELIGNRNTGIEIGSGATNSMYIRGNTISGSTTISPLTNGTTEYGIVVTTSAAPTGAVGISGNEIQMYGRAGIECRGCIGNGLTSGNGSFRIASNYITQAAGPYLSAPAASLQNEIRDVAGIAVGNLQSGTTPSLVAVDTNQVESILQPNSATTAYTAFGIVSSGTSIIHRCNIVTGCEIGMQAQQGAPGNENNTPDNFYSRDNTATTTNYLANRNSIYSSTDFGARNQVGGTINFEGNWWGDPTGPTHAANTSPSGAGELLPAGSGIAYNAFMGADPDDNVGTSSGQRGIQVTSGKNFRLKPTANATSLSAPYVINQGINVGFGTATTGFSDTLDIYSYPTTYSLPNESIKVTRAMYLRGNFGNSPMPIISGTGSSVHPVEQSPNARMLINLAARNAGFENLNIRFSAPFIVFGVSSLMGIADTVNSDASVLDGLRIKNNLIENTGSGQFYSFGIYLKSASRQSDPSTVVIDGNTIRNAGGNYGFGSAIRMWGLRGSVINNTLVGGFSLRWGNPATGSGTTTIDNNLLIGGVELNSPANNTTLNITNNIFRRDSLSGGAHSMNLEIRLQQYPATTVNIDNNRFERVYGSGYPFWGVLSLRSQNVNITNNDFTAGPSATDFCFIHASTRQMGTSSNPTTFDNSLTVKGNTFTGNAQTGTTRTAINLARHRSSQTFSSVTIGGPGAEANTFKSNMNTFIEMDPFTGMFSSLGLPYTALVGTPDSPIVPFDVSLDASQNVFGVSGGDKSPLSMTQNELLEVEDKIQHAIDYDQLGFVTVRPKNKYVTTLSYITGYTSTPLLARALATDVIREADTLTMETNTYNETVTVDSSYVFANNGTTVLQNLTMNGPGKTLTLENDFEVSNGGTLTLTDGIIATGSNILRVTNPSAGAISGGSNSSHVNGNLNRAINTGTLYPFTVGNGSFLEELSLNFTSVSLLTDVTVSFTNAAPGASMTNFNESGAYYDNTRVLQTGYWAVTPNVGGTSTNYHIRLKPVNFTDFPSGMGMYTYTALKRVGASPWGQDGTWDNPGTGNRVFGDGTVRRSGLSGFSNFGVGGSQNVPLPIALSHFTAVRKNRDVALQWKTQSEVNFSHFNVQRSDNGVDFETLTSVKGRSKEGSSYQWTDVNPFDYSTDRLFYRLESVDVDLKTEFSPVRMVKANDDEGGIASIIYPNPATATIQILRKDLMNATFTITDVLGKTVITATETSQINVSHLAPGVYTILISTPQGTEKHRFTKE